MSELFFMAAMVQNLPPMIWVTQIRR